MQRIFTLSLVTAALIVLTTTVAAQDADNPWHLIVMNEDSIELAAFNVETLDNLSLSDGQVGIKMTWDSKSQNYSYPVASTFFAFDPRKDGVGTANENLTLPQWNVQYANGNLHFSESVSCVAVYSLAGALVAKYAGIYTEVPITLPQGLYIIQANGQSAKLPVSTGGIGSTTSQLTTIETQTAPFTPDLPATNLRAATIKIYWNITAGNTIMPVEIPNVEKFYFTVDNSIVFTLKNGNTIEMANYKGVEFAIESAQTTTNSQWDLSKYEFWGASYGIVMTPSDCKLSSIYLAVVHSKGIIIFDNAQQKEVKYPIANIHSKIWSLYPEYKRTISFWDVTTGDGYLLKDVGTVLLMNDDFKFIIGTTGEVFVINRKIFLTADTEVQIPSSININPDGTVTVTSAGISHTFDGW
jgi:hypothetical protein